MLVASCGSERPLNLDLNCTWVAEAVVGVEASSPGLEPWCSGSRSCTVDVDGPGCGSVLRECVPLVAPAAGISISLPVDSDLSAVTLTRVEEFEEEELRRLRLSFLM